MRLLPVYYARAISKIFPPFQMILIAAIAVPGASAQAFQSSNYSIGSYWPGGLSLGDFNGDGIPDAVTANAGNQDVSILLGNGTGGFGAPAIIPLFPYHAGTVNALSDLNNDGMLDLLSGDLQGSIMVLLGNGTGAFNFFTQYGTFFPLSTPEDIECIRVCDINGDGIPDQVVLDNNSRNYYIGATALILIGNGTAGLAGVNSFAIPPGAYRLDVGDLNQDGQLDIVTANGGSIAYSTSDASIYLGNGLGGFGPATTLVFGLSPIAPLIADVNRDGFADLVFADYLTCTVDVFLGDGGTSWTPHSSTPTSGGALGVGPADFAVADFDADGDLDIVVHNFDAWTASVLHGDGSGSFSLSNIISTGANPLRSAVADLDGDGRMDVVNANLQGGSITVLLNSSSVLPSLGTKNYGNGTGGCLGYIGLNVNKNPKINTPDFGFISTNVPTKALGLLLITDSADIQGHDIFGIGATLHVDFYFATQIYGLDMISDEGSTAFESVPLPNNASLVGQVYYSQSVWVESTASGQACSPSPFHLASSRALQLTIEP